MRTSEVPPSAIASSTADPDASASRITVVVPVYQGERTLEPLLAEIEALARPRGTPKGQRFQVTEVILVHDGAIDDSRRVMEALAERYPFVTLVWLSRNYGQHPATLAGMAASSGDWVVTLDEDGQQDPADIAALLDRAVEANVPLVYAQPINPPPHAAWRNAASSLVKILSVLLVGNRALSGFNSFRLVRGDLARSLAAYCGTGVYLDVALSWVIGQSALCPVTLRAEHERSSGYTFRKLIAHLGRLVLTAGTRPLRVIFILGLLSVLSGFVISAHTVWLKVTHQIPVQGWTSLIIVVCFFSALILFSLGVIAEYLSLVLTTTMGKPLYLTVAPPPGGKNQGCP